ncbi:nitrite reductase (NAD(P)H) small subunit [Actinomadura graeca]|uniref:Nitrite reductase (NAD(P)H) small subunit n=1 Tax=Actinomadura graeca TaxID=2750812 RepID=A0ABX8R3R4_9ACTN|nr:nitrite reductase (NAD(P)H) small subunit [Actinomadura graeca]QXJ25670.1 nitrite reductase (NAD(P)H) small subunit [Actinomadura graeca]
MRIGSWTTKETRPRGPRWRTACRWSLFRTFEGELFATPDLGLFSDAYVISRGILGTRGTVPAVASPMFKRVCDSRTGCCLGEPALPTFVIRRVPDGDRVEVALPYEDRE